MADIGERLGGDNIEFTVDKPLRIIIGGPPHSGKSTFMNLLEDRFRYYQIPVELVDLDLSAPTPLKTGFTQQREKKKWTSTLAEEARKMFEGAEGVQVVLGDSVGLISDINEIISQPADVAILLVSGGHGDYDTTYRKVVRKWKEYYQDIRTPLLVVLRSTMNPADESMFDPQDNYGVVVGLDRDAYEANTISGHYLYDGIYPTNACLEGVVFEIAQSFDLKVRSATDPEHLDLLNQKWPDLKDKKTWTPPADSMLGGIERAYFEERGRVPADQRAEYYDKYYTPNKLDPKVGDEAMFEGGEIRIINVEAIPDVIFYTYLDEEGKSDGFIRNRDIAKFVDRWSPFPMEKESFGADFKVGMDGDFEDHEEGEVGSEHLVTYTLDNGIVAPVFEGYTIMSKDGMNSGKRIDGYLIGIAEDNQWWQPEGGVPTRSEINEVFGAESFGADSTPRFIPVEVIKYADWWTRRYGREYNPRGVNNYDYSYVVCVRDIPIAHFDTKEKAENHARTARTTINVLGGMSDSRIDHPLALKEMDGYANKNIRGGMNMAESFGAEDDLSFKEWADQETMTHGQQEPFDDWLNDELSSHGDNITLQDWGQHELDSHYERYGAEDNLKALKAIYTPYIGKQVRFITKYGLDKDDMFVDIETIHSIAWDGGEDEYDEPVFLNKEGDRWMTLDYVKENLVENKAAEGKIHSQLMIGSFIGLGAGLWAVNKFKESREEK